MYYKSNSFLYFIVNSNNKQKCIIKNVSQRKIIVKYK